MNSEDAHQRIEELERALTGIYAEASHALPGEEQIEAAVRESMYHGLHRIRSAVREALGQIPPGSMRGTGSEILQEFEDRKSVV